MYNTYNTWHNGSSCGKTEWNRQHKSANKYQLRPKRVWQKFLAIVYPWKSESEFEIRIRIRNSNWAINMTEKSWQKQTKSSRDQRKIVNL